MKRKFILFVSSPFVALGFVWQFLAGGFAAGRMLATMWVHSEADKILEQRLRAAAQTVAEATKAAQQKSKLN